MSLLQPIIEMVLLVTNHCNLKCGYCYAPGTHTEMLSEETGRQAVTWFIEQGRAARRPLTIAFYGGEPLLGYDLITRLIRCARGQAAAAGREVRFGITTNGTLLTERRLEFFRKENVGLIVSIDGDRETHDRFRRTATGEGSFARLERLLPALIEHRPGSYARMTVNPETVDRLSENAIYLIGQGFRNLAVAPNIEAPWERADWELFDRQCRKIANTYLEWVAAGDWINVSFIQDGIVRLLQGKRPPAPCGAGKTLVGVGVSGEIFPCHRFAAAADYRGSLPLGDVWRGLDESFRLPFARYTSEHCLGCHSPCSRCPGKDICGGGCLAKAYEYNGNFLLPLRAEQYVYSIWADIARQVLQLLSEHHEWVLERLVAEKGSGGPGHSGDALC